MRSWGSLWDTDILSYWGPSANCEFSRTNPTRAWEGWHMNQQPPSSTAWEFPPRGINHPTLLEFACLKHNKSQWCWGNFSKKTGSEPDSGDRELSVCCRPHTSATLKDCVDQDTTRTHYSVSWVSQHPPNWHWIISLIIVNSTTNPPNPRETQYHHLLMNYCLLGTETSVITISPVCKSRDFLHSINNQI